MTTTRRKFAPTKLFLSIATATALLAGSQVYAEGLSIEEITVTAQKRAESVQDIAASIAAVTSEALNNNGITEFEDATKMVPGLRLRQSNATDVSISLRGLSYDRQSATDEAVDVYWNGATYSAVSVFTSMFDVDRLEVLRGPQGTLQGKTSPAGSIQLHTKRPSFDEVEGQVKMSWGNDETRITEFGISLPVSDTLAFRLAGIYSANEGGESRNAFTFDGENNRAKGIRLTTVWQPSDDFDLMLANEYLEHSTHNYFTMAGDGAHGD